MTALISRIAPALALVISLLVVNIAHAAEPVSKSRFAGVAIGGHDSVAYHKLDREALADAIKGKKTFTVKHKGAKWRFGTQESADLFKANPDKYSPAYNGHCANALSLGNGLLRTDGQVWEIYDDKLYLFYAEKGRTRWGDGNWATYKITADEEWAKLSKP